ncbi:MAG: uroporphyrinogen decarboxylase family protein [bacterium]
MNSKERVLTAISHRQPDRVPIDFSATPEVWEKLKKHFGTSDSEEVLIKLGVDIRGIRGKYVGPPLPRYPDGSWEDVYGIRLKSVRYDTGAYDEVAVFVLDDAKTPKDIESHRWPSADWFDFTRVPEACKRLEDYAIVAGGPGVFQRVTWLRRMDKVLMDMVEQPEMAATLMGKLTDFHEAYYSRFLEAGRGGIDILYVTDDYGMQGGLLMSPELWRKFIAGNLRRLVDVAHKYGAKFMLHSCGSVRELIPDLIDIGVDVLDPIQTQAKGMNPDELKAEFGDALSFHGAIDTQTTLPFGDADGVRREVRQRIEVMGKGGGYILAPTHNIQPDTPLENILAMYRTAMGLE